MKTVNTQKYKVQTLLSVITVLIGTVLMIGKMYADSEPGAIPLLMILLGVGWYFIARAKIRSQHGLS